MQCYFVVDCILTSLKLIFHSHFHSQWSQGSHKHNIDILPKFWPLSFESVKSILTVWLGMIVAVIEICHDEKFQTMTSWTFRETIVGGGLSTHVCSAHTVICYVSPTFSRVVPLKTCAKMASWCKPTILKTEITQRLRDIETWYLALIDL